MLKFLDNFYDSLNDDYFLLTIFMDFSKAFDTISIDILLKKLHRYGFQTFIYSWLRSYLSGRKQFVSIGTNSSETINTVMGAIERPGTRHRPGKSPALLSTTRPRHGFLQLKYPAPASSPAPAKKRSPAPASGPSPAKSQARARQNLKPGTGFRPGPGKYLSPVDLYSKPP